VQWPGSFGVSSRAASSRPKTADTPTEAFRGDDIPLRSRSRLLFAAGVHPKVVQERPAIRRSGLPTRTHVVPTMQPEAAGG
jgi:hypothetical protein